MAQGGEAGAPPVRLWVRRVGVYCDEHRKTWLVAAEEFLNMSQKDPCQKQACEIQKCLQANNYLESKCEAVLQEMRKCCARYGKGRSVCCSGFEREEREREKVKLASEGISPPPQ
ncbi:cx9C motif-containing protein 4-like isoform X2 [Hirundo rustica]|uniref:cx9C motif-containing protein 4-like isoform X2 n=1 Tax=Hirundo rustica TaxID=43150 RepID=UPI001A93DBBB|nr:cx9C motif-containing protein 4-like isoform X2 [Hirundo rustica]